MDSDFVVGIDKSIDAAKGITGKEYPSYLHNTVVTEKLDELAEAIGEGSGGASALSDLTDVDISGSVQDGKVLKYNAVEEKWAPGDDSGNAETEIPGTLAAGESTITLQNAAITTDSKIDYYADVFGVHPINAIVTTGQIVLTYRPRATAINIKVVVS